MKSLIEYLNNYVCESKLQIQSINIPFEEWVNNLPNDDGKAEVKEYTDAPQNTRLGYDSDIVVTTSFLAAINYAKDKDKSTIAIIPFNNFWLVVEISIRDSQNFDIKLFAIKQSNASLKFVLNINKSAFKHFIDLFTFKKDNVKNILLQAKDRILNDKYNFIKGVEEDFGDEAIQKKANDKAAAKVPSPDKSPYTFSTSKKLPNYIKIHKVTATENPIVKKYTAEYEAEIFVETVIKDNKKYYKVLMGDFKDYFFTQYDKSICMYYLTTLGQLDKFLEYTLKPSRQRHHSVLGPDGEIHVWSSTIEKKLPAILQKDCIHDETLIKSLKFHSWDAVSIYNSDFTL